MSLTSAVVNALEKANVFDPLCVATSSDLVISNAGFAISVVQLLRFRIGRSKLLGRCVVVVPSQSDALDLVEEISSLDLGIEPVLVPPWETLPFERVSPRIDAMGRRVAALWDLAQGKNDAARDRVFVFSARSFSQRFHPRLLEYAPLAFDVGGSINLDFVAHKLISFGYTRVYQVEAVGEFAIRGSILDIFTADRDVPVRVDLFGDDIEKIVEFSLADQRSVTNSGVGIGSVLVHPAREFRPEEFIRQNARELSLQIPKLSDVFNRILDGEFFEGMESWAPFFEQFEASVSSLLVDDDLLIVSDLSRIIQRIGALVDEEDELFGLLAATWDLDPNEQFDISLFDSLEDSMPRCQARIVKVKSFAEKPSDLRIDIEPVGIPDHRDDTILGTLRADLRAGLMVIITADSPSMANRIITSVKDGGLMAKAIRTDLEFDEFLNTPVHKRPIGCIITDLETGFRSAKAQMSIIGPYDLTGRRLKRTQRQVVASRAGIAMFESLQSGGYVVHDFHGVGKYHGMIRREVGGVERDYLEIEYRDNAKLFLPTEQMSVITPYSGGEKPALSKLGGSDWHKTKARVKKSVERIAQELVLLYQKRVNAKGIVHSPDTVWQAEMEELFPYTLTTDQRKAIEDVKQDMETERPMDRLVCGDVGFGKTEIAIRAAFKAVQSGKQVAVLVPTTLLAHQHHQTFSERFGHFPVTVEVISRFFTSAQVKEVLARLARGEVDVIIGTHRLLSKDVIFADLGLLVVDEEQRFGVNHKETIKAMSVNIDVLTLSATPIPRTLEMSLTGLRDLSLLNTPPGSRQPILTYVGGYDEAAVVEAIRREMLREGQVFFVHNRILDIETVASRLRVMVPEARVAVAHGQMDESQLERVVDDFWQGKFDVLVCTTIIESGIDMPSVNTLVVDRAEMLGLGQLHQLRGRVGRGGIRAYAYLFHAPDTKLTEEAYERLKTIGEAVELGSGFRIAMRDLEIRGAGNLLSQNQSGHIAAVGYDLYVKMVKDAIAFLNGDVVKPPSEVRIDIPLTATIPLSYIGKDSLRLEAYKALADTSDDGEIAELVGGWEDRFGDLPPETVALTKITQLRNRATTLGITEITGEIQKTSVNSKLKLRIVGVAPPQSVLVNLRRRFPKSDFHEFSKTLSIPDLDTKQPADIAIELLDLLIKRLVLKPVSVG